MAFRDSGSGSRPTQPRSSPVFGPPSPEFLAPLTPMMRVGTALEPGRRKDASTDTVVLIAVRDDCGRLWRQAGNRAADLGFSGPRMLMKSWRWGKTARLPAPW